MKTTRRILVTGASGFIGSNLVSRWRQHGHDAVPWVRAMGDLRDAPAVAAQLNALRPDAIVHLASSAPATGADAWAAAGDDTAMLTNLAFAMPDGCRLLYTGSMAEYGRAGVLDERDPCRPVTPYGRAKLGATHAALALRTTHGFDIRVARLFGAYGPGEGKQRLIPWLVERLLVGRQVPLTDGLQVRDFVHVDDVCDCIAAMLDAPAVDFPVVNIGTGVGVSVRHVCQQVAGLIGADLGLLQFGAVPRRAVDEDQLVARIDRLASITAVPPQHWLSSGPALSYVLDAAR